MTVAELMRILRKANPESEVEFVTHRFNVAGTVFPIQEVYQSTLCPDNEEEPQEPAPIVLT